MHAPTHIPVFGLKCPSKSVQFQIEGFRMGYAGVTLSKLFSVSCETHQKKSVDAFIFTTYCGS